MLTQFHFKITNDPLNIFIYKLLLTYFKFIATQFIKIINEPFYKILIRNCYIKNIKS
jgi:hypothetical protein